MDLVVVIVFAFTYAGMALGRVPGLKIDRSGMALLGVVALLASGRIESESIGRAVDAPTLLLLFALMIVSAQFQAAGLYRVVAARVAASSGSPDRLLLAAILSGGLLSALLANDIVVFAMAPILAEGVRRRGMDPRPFLLGLAGGANAGSAMTIIGNPQNILIGQTGGLDFREFLLAAGVPGLAALMVVWLVVRRVWRAELAVPPAVPCDPLPGLDRWQTGKGVLAVAALVALFATSLPREVGALVIAGLLLASRRLSSRDMLGAVDWHLLVLFAGLFVVTQSFAAGLAIALPAGVERLSLMAPLALLGSNTIGNVPAVMLALALWTPSGPGPLYGLALLSTLAGNLLLVGSLANIIVAERAAASGVRLTFADFARAGIPMTLASMAVGGLWLWAGGWMEW